MKYLLFLLTTTCFADIGPQGFGNYRNEYFVETGTCCGRAIFTAMRSGFRKIISIESDLNFYTGSHSLFKRCPFIKIYFGDSSLVLWDLIKDIDCPITFWLDAHRYPPLEDGMKNSPLLEELNQIQQHPIKTHTILIDDMACCGKLDFDYLTREEIIRKVLEINSAYQIAFVDGGTAGEAKANVLVATILKNR